MVIERFSVEGRVAIVTGAGRGLGAASALALAQAGADVLISSRTESQLVQVAERVEALGRRCVVVPTDLNDLDSVASLASQAENDLGRLDIVVNNLGGTMPRAFLDTTPEFLEEAFHFNVSTAHALTRAAVPIMLARDGGSVVNISSAMSRLVGRGFLAYGTAKAAMSHYTRLAARDLAPRIRVNAIAVGSIATSALDIVVNDDGLRSAMEAATPLHAIGDPEHIAATVLYLASPAGGYVTGKVVEVDGGTEQPSLELGLPDL